MNLLFRVLNRVCTFVREVCSCVQSGKKGREEVGGRGGRGGGGTDWKVAVRGYMARRQLVQICVARSGFLVVAGEGLVSTPHTTIPYSTKRSDSPWSCCVVPLGAAQSGVESMVRSFFFLFPFFLAGHVSKCYDFEREALFFKVGGVFCSYVAIASGSLR